MRKGGEDFLSLFFKKAIARYEKNKR